MPHLSISEIPTTVIFIVRKAKFWQASKERHIHERKKREKYLEEIAKKLKKRKTMEWSEMINSKKRELRNVWKKGTEQCTNVK